MDVQMPAMDGFKATAIIRQRESKSGGHVPIIAMIAHAMEGDRERCLEVGMDGYVAKPIRAKDLHDTIVGVNLATWSWQKRSARFEEVTLLSWFREDSTR